MQGRKTAHKCDCHQILIITNDIITNIIWNAALILEQYEQFIRLLVKVRSPSFPRNSNLKEYAPFVQVNAEYGSRLQTYNKNMYEKDTRNELHTTDYRTIE